MLIKYIQIAMGRAKYEILEDDGSIYGHIPELPGVWSNAATLEECREQLESVLEGWIMLGISRHHSFPILDGIELQVPVAAD